MVSQYRIVSKKTMDLQMGDQWNKYSEIHYYVYADRYKKKDTWWPNIFSWRSYCDTNELRLIETAGWFMSSNFMSL